MPAYRRLMQKSMPADTVVVSVFRHGEAVGARYGWAAAMHRSGAVRAFESAIMAPEAALGAAEAARETHRDMRLTAWAVTLALVLALIAAFYLLTR